MRRKNDDDVFDGETNAQEEQFSEDEETSHIKKPKAYSHLTDAQYNRCILREKFVGLAQTDKQSAMRFLRENERRFKNAGYDKRALEEMHRSMYITGYGGLTTDDTRLLISVFGPHVKSRPTPENTQGSVHPSPEMK